MFDSIGWGEIIVLGLAALFIFGPERLPTLAKDAAHGLKRVREAITGVREQDIVIAVDGDPVGSSEDLTVAVDAHAPGDTVTIEVVRGGSSSELKATLDTA